MNSINTVKKLALVFRKSITCNIHIALIAFSSSFLEVHAQQEVTFQVNMQNQTVSPNGVHVAGNWQSEAGLANGDWQPNTAMMTDDDGDGIYAYTCSLPNGVYEYKFINGNSWGLDESQIPVICQVGGGNSNRFFVVDNSAVATIPVEFNGSAALDAGITFKPMRFTVDIPTSLTVDPTGIYLSGTFMNEFTNENLTDWIDKIKLHDINAGDGVANYTGIVYYPEAVTGTFNYSFYNGSTQELLPTACQGGAFPTRFFDLDATSELTPKFCFASCDESCVTLATYNATINIDMRYNCGFDVNSNDSVDVAGTFNNYQGGPAYLLSDADNDGIYSITLPLQAGEFQYKARIIRNGNFSGGWEGGSNTIVLLQSNTSLAARCFGFSSGQCAPIPAPSDITFSVDLSDVIPSGSVFLMGDFTSPPYQGGAIAMTSIGAGIYQTTVNDICAGTINFKFVNGSPNNGANEENFNGSSTDCIVPNGIGGYNRFYVRESNAPVQLNFIYNTCISTSNGNISYTGPSTGQALNPNPISFISLPFGCPSFSYQWYSFNGITSAPSGNSTSGWTLIPGATSSSYDPPTLFQSTTFACFVTPSAGCGTAGWAQGAASFTITSSAGQVNSTLVQQCEIAPVELSFTAAPGGLGSVAYQWYYQNGEVGCPQGSSTFGWQIVSGANGATGSFTPPSSGTYTLACFVNSETGVGLWASGCKQVVSTSFTAQEIIGNTTVTPFTPTAYLVNQIAGHTYQWTVTGGAIANGQGTNFVNVVWNNTGPYNIQLIESDGVCSDVSMLELGIVTGIENEDEGGIKIYPNPAKDFFIVESDTQLQGEYEIYDLAGKLLQSGQLNKTNNQSIAFINPHSPGFYLLRLNKSLTYKLLMH